MKKTWFVVLAFSFLGIVSFASLAVADEMTDMKAMHHNMQADKSSMEKDMPVNVPMKGMMDGKECMMMKDSKGMMNMSMSVLPDGSIVILAGNKLIKYDKDLNLIKEVEIKIEMGGKHKIDMMKKCPKMVPDTKIDSLSEMDMQDDAN